MRRMENNSIKIWARLPKKGNSETVHYYHDQHEDNLPFLIRWLLNYYKLRRASKDEFDKEGFYPINLMIHSAKDLLGGQPTSEEDAYDFAQEQLRNVGSDDEQIFPIVHLAMSDLFIDSLLGISQHPEDVPRNYMIMDNSIWNYLVPVQDTYYINNLVDYKESKNGNSNFKEFELSVRQYWKVNFYDAVCSICKNYEKKLYRLTVAREFADLNARLTKQSFLTGTHASGVSPFVFHSECVTKQMIQREFRLNEEKKVLPYNIGGKYLPNSLLDRICNHKWRILLLDDKAITPMGASRYQKTNKESDNNEEIQDDRKTKGSWNCKLTIIRKLLEKQLDLEKKVAYKPCCHNINKITEELEDSTVIMEPADDTVLLIEYAQNLEDAKSAMKEKKYDFVLIDYLLDQKDGTHYGYELLEDIWYDQQQHKKDEKHLQYKVTPHRSQRLYCMFISAYSSAVHDRLLAEGLNLSEEFWHINLGACPTNTPQLFLYNLIKLMEKRLDDSNLERLSIDGIMDDLDKIFGEEGKERTYASEQYYKIQSYQYYFRTLLKDYDITAGDENLFETNQSVLITDFLNDNINMGGLLEHLAQLVHLTGFGTIRQWPEMWEEYLYVKVQLESLIKDGDKEREQKLENLCHHIENYIKKLKSSAL